MSFADAQTRQDDLDLLCGMLASTWHYGHWKAETINERDMQALLERLGWWPVTEATLIAKRGDTT
jgi:hypothetical protein